MSDFDLDLMAVEDHIDEEFDLEGSIVLGVLDGSTDPTTWLEAVGNGNVLVLRGEGDINELATGFARDVKESGGNLIHFRGFLIVTPPGINVDTSRLG